MSPLSRAARPGRGCGAGLEVGGSWNEVSVSESYQWLAAGAHGTLRQRTKEAAGAGPQWHWPVWLNSDVYSVKKKKKSLAYSIIAYASVYGAGN